MTHDWLLVETLGDEPAVVARGRELKKLVPITTFLRRSPYLAAVRTAIAETLQTGQSLTSITPKHDRVIRTEPVIMTDGRMHGVQVWSGPTDAEPPDRPIPGPLKWDLTRGVATDTPESLTNSGKNPEVEITYGRAFAEDLPARELNPNETQVLAMAVKAKPGKTLCSIWDLTDWQGTPIRIGFVARSALEPGPNGRDHLVARAMNWRAETKAPAVPVDDLAQRILIGLAQAGVHRALVDLKTWTLLKWLDQPCSFYDWRRSAADGPRLHPDRPARDRRHDKRPRQRIGQSCAALAWARRRLGAGPCHRQPDRARTGYLRWTGRSATAHRRRTCRRRTAESHRRHHLTTSPFDSATAAADPRLPLLVVNGLTVIRTARSLSGLRPRCRSDCVDESYAL